MSVDFADRLWTPPVRDDNPQALGLPTQAQLDEYYSRNRRFVRYIRDGKPRYSQLPSGGMADVKEGFGTATAFTITLNSLASSGTAGRQSTVIDNSSTKMLDALVEPLIDYPASAPANDQAIYGYAFGSLDGTNYPESLGASDAAYTWKGSAGALKTALRLIFVLPCVNAMNYRFGPFPVAPAFGGILPPKWGIAMLNYSGQTLDASGNAAQYREVYATSL